MDDEPKKLTAGDAAASADPWADFNHPTKSFYSSSDESDDDTTKKKIRVEIKPVVPNGSGGADGSSPAISASLNELERAVGGLEIVPPPLVRIFCDGSFTTIIFYAHCFLFLLLLYKTS